MIDRDDADMFWLASMFSNGPMGFFLFIAFIVVLFIAIGNEGDCAKKSCPNSQTAKLMDNACLCVMEAK